VLLTWQQRVPCVLLLAWLSPPLLLLHWLHLLLDLHCCWVGWLHLQWGLRLLGQWQQVLVLVLLAAALAAQAVLAGWRLLASAGAAGATAACWEPHGRVVAPCLLALHHVLPAGPAVRARQVVAALAPRLLALLGPPQALGCETWLLLAVMLVVSWMTLLLLLLLLLLLMLLLPTLLGWRPAMAELGVLLPALLHQCS
jgi:hypothetical protein